MVALIGFAFLFGSAGVIVLSAILSFAALREFVTLTNTRPGDHGALLAAFFVALPVQYILVWYEWYGLYAIFIPVYAFLLMPVIAVLRGDTRRFLERISVVQWALMLCVFCLSHVPALLALNIPGFEGRQLGLIVFLVAVVQASDVLQYVWGKLAGRTKIAPSVSPSKTVEGFTGGVVSAALLGAGLWWITPFAPWQAALLAFVITLMGFIGGLVMSAIKARPGGQGLGPDDRRPWRHLGPPRLADLRGADLLPPGALFLAAVKSARLSGPLHRNPIHHDKTPANAGVCPSGTSLCSAKQKGPDESGPF